MLNWDKQSFLLMCDVEWCDVELDTIHFKIKYKNDTYIIKPDMIINIHKLTEDIQINYQDILEYIELMS